MKEIRFHGRGGQGAVMATEMLTTAFVLEGKYSAAFPMFGFERRGAPVTAFLRYDDKPIREKTMIYQPDCLFVIDRTSVESPMVFLGLKEGGILLANITKPVKEDVRKNLSKVGMIDATAIALEEIGIRAANTAMLGAFAATTGWVTLEYVIKALERYFEGRALDRNIACAKRGFKEVKIDEI